MKYLWFRVRIWIKHRILGLNCYNLRRAEWTAICDIAGDLHHDLAEGLDWVSESDLIVQALLRAWKRNPHWEGKR